MKMLGLKVILQADPVVQPIAHKSLSEFWQRHIRWGRIRKSQEPLAFAFELLFGPFISGLFGAWGISLMTGFNFAVLWGLHVSIWCYCDLKLNAFLSARSIKVTTVFWWFAREALHLPLWIQVASGNTVLWRGQRLRVGPGGILETKPI